MLNKVLPDCAPARLFWLAVVYHCLSGTSTTRPSSSGVMMIWQQSLLFGFSSAVTHSSMPISRSLAAGTLSVNASFT